MGVKANKLNYQLLRKTQSRIVRLQEFKRGELWDIYNSSNIQIYADHLAHKYFHKSSNLEIYQDLRRIYKAYLVLAPVLQRQKYAFKIDWHRGHLLSWARRSVNGRVKRFFYINEEMERELKVDIFNHNLLSMGIKDVPFLEELLDLYRCYYNSSGVKGQLVNCIFDGVMFLHKGDGYRIRVGNRFYRLEKKPEHSGRWIDLRDSFARIWDYEIKYRAPKQNSSGKLDIRVSQNVIREFRNNIKIILDSNSTPEHKIAICYKRIESFVESAKYAKSALLQLLDLRQWLRQKTSKLAGTERKVKLLPDMIVNLWTRNNSKDKVFLNTPNFFWSSDISRPEKIVYDIFFSPYRES